MINIVNSYYLLFFPLLLQLQISNYKFAEFKNPHGEVVFGEAVRVLYV